MRRIGNLIASGFYKLGSTPFSIAFMFLGFIISVALGTAGFNTGAVIALILFVLTTIFAVTRRGK